MEVKTKSLNRLGYDRLVFDVLHAVRGQTPKEIEEKTEKRGFQRVSRSNIRNWRSGKVLHPSGHLLFSVAWAYGYKIILVSKEDVKLVKTRQRSEDRAAA